MRFRLALLYTIGLSILSSSFVFAESSNNREISKMTKQCEKLWRSEKYDRALACAEEIVEKYPDNAVGYIGLAAYWIKVGNDPKKGIEYLNTARTKIIEKEDDLYGIDSWLAYGLFVSKDFKNAKKTAEQAHDNCQKSKNKKECSTEIRNLLEDIDLAIQQPNIEYTQKYVDGNLYDIGTDKNKQVWISTNLVGKKYIAALVVFINQSKGDLNIVPENIKLKSFTKNKILDLKTFSPEEFAKELEREQKKQEFWTSLFLGVANGVNAGVAAANDQRSNSRYYYGSVNSPTGEYLGSYSGYVPGPNRVGEYTAIAQEKTNAAVQDMSRAMTEESVSLLQKLLKRHTIPPNGWYGGLVYMKYKKADSFRVVVPFGDSSFVFSYSGKK